MVRRWTFVEVGLIVVFASLSLQTTGSAEERYRVKQGDNLYTIAKKHGISTEALKRANGLRRNDLKVNQLLVVPSAHGEKRPSVEVVKLPSPGRGKPAPVQISVKPAGGTESYIVKAGDSLYGISKKWGLSVEEIKRVNRLQSTALKTGQMLAFPRPGRQEIEAEPEELGDGEEAPEGGLTQANGVNQESSEPLGKWNGSEERNLLVRVVKTFLGAPYRLGGSTVRGLDCSAFVKKIYEIFRVDLPRTAWEQFRIGKGVQRNELEEGDLVFFKTRRANGAHVGIYIGNDQFVHASSHNREVKIDNLTAPYYTRHFLRGVRVKELEKEI